MVIILPTGKMIFRKQIILGAVATFFFLKFLAGINNTGTGMEGKRNLALQEENMHQIMSAIGELTRMVDALASHVKIDIGMTNSKSLTEWRKLGDRKLSLQEEEEEHKKLDVAKQEHLSEKVNSSNQFDMLNGRLVSSRGETVKVVILVGSTARSGTSFLGELLSQFDNVLYLFEPELYIRARTHEMVTEGNGIELLRNMIYCRISDDFAGWLKTRATSFNIFRHPITRSHCKDWSTCLTPSRLEQACRQEHIRIMKVIRIRMAWLKPLLDDPLVDLKVIHLVRDPRGSLYSMAKNQLHKLDPGYYCPLIEDDILQTPRLMQKYPGKVLGLSYEQLCLDPMGKATEIWKFLVGESDAELPSKWAVYMENHISRSSERRVAVYGTVRNSNEQYQAWRKDITEQALSEIEAHCASVLKRLGYNLFGSLERTRNTSYTLFMNKEDLIN